jgi:hypothetical protein
LLELAIAEYRRRTASRDMSGPRGVIAHGMGGRLPTHETTWLATPNPTRCTHRPGSTSSSSPTCSGSADGRALVQRQLEDSFTNDVAYLSSRTVGSVGGWYLIAHESWAGERPRTVMDEIRIPTPIAWLLLRIAATPQNEDLHARYQAVQAPAPRDLPAQPEGGSPGEPRSRRPAEAAVRASNEPRDARRLHHQHRLRQLGPRPGGCAARALRSRRLRTERELELTPSCRARWWTVYAARRATHTS